MAGEYGTRKDGKVYPKRGVVIVSAVVPMKSQDLAYAEGEGPGEGEVDNCTKCRKLTKYKLGGTPICRKCYEEI